MLVSDPTSLHGVQRTLDDLGTALADVTFCVVDLETTGGAPQTDAITEIGAVKLRGGECLGTFQTLVNPGCAIPPRITMLTGISESMVLTAPRVETALASFLEFLGGAVIVGHNVRFETLDILHFRNLSEAHFDCVIGVVTEQDTSMRLKSYGFWVHVTF